MGVKVTGQFEPAGDFSIVDGADVSGNITGSNISSSGELEAASIGTKLASIIGGSGNVKVIFSSPENIKINHKADKLMASAININTGFIEAIELKGEGEILGVLWPVLGNKKLPNGFENIVNYIVD